MFQPNAKRYQYSLRTFIGAFISISAFCALIAVAERNTAFGSVFVAVLYRILAILVVGSVTGKVVGNTRGAMAAVATGLLIADVGWITVLAWEGHPLFSKMALANPLILVTLATGAAACARGRVRSLLLGLFLSVGLPMILMLFPWVVMLIGIHPSYSIVIAGLGVGVGVTGTVMSRFMFELVGSLSGFDSAAV